MHLYLDNSDYFITCRTKDKKNYFATGKIKSLILDKFYIVKGKFNLDNFTFAILNNHYHFKTFIKNGSDLPKIMQLINGKISKELNLNLGYRLWDVYYDRIVDSEKDPNKVIGYIIGNPYKHRLVKSIEELSDYKFCSFKEIAEKYGSEAAYEIVGSVVNLNWE
jgi:REP element-mobilizing transposase RayT